MPHHSPTPPRDAWPLTRVQTDRNAARAAISVLDQPTRHLAHWAHYVDAYRKCGSDQVAFAVRNYLAACEAVGAMG